MLWNGDDPEGKLRLRQLREQAVVPVLVKTVALLFEPLGHGHTELSAFPWIVPLNAAVVSFETYCRSA